MNAIRKTSEKELVTKIALAKGIKDVKKLVADLAPGKYAVDGTIHVHGTVNRGEDFEKVIPNKIKWSLLAAILASKVNDVTLESVIDTYLNADAAGDLKDLEKSVKDKVQVKIDEIKGTTRSLVNGQVRATVGIDFADLKVKFDDN